MVHDQRSGLLSVGRVVFTREEAEQELGVGRGAFVVALHSTSCISRFREGVMKQFFYDRSILPRCCTMHYRFPNASELASRARPLAESRPMV